MNCLIAALPKVELHLHLEGALRLKTVRHFRRSASLEELPAPSWRRRSHHYDGLPGFLSTIKAVLQGLPQTPEHYERITYELFTDLAAQNVRYVEASFGGDRAIRFGQSFDELVHAVNSGAARAAKRQPIRFGLIAASDRASGPALAAAVARMASKARASGVVGIDLHGDETAGTADDFAETYEIAREAGLGLRAHAGEGAGPESVWGAIRTLGVSRIAHGVRAGEDPALLDYLRRNPVTLDMCPTSNVKLGLVADLSAHPIRRFMDLGIRVTVNSDDPLFFNTTISGEYEVLHRRLGFTLSELNALTLNAVDAAFLPPSDKTALRADIENASVANRDPLASSSR